MEGYSKRPSINSPSTNSQTLKNRSTDAKQKLWQFLSHKQVLNVQFNRKKTIKNFIVDFYCAKAKLVIEIDGALHFDMTHRFRDTIKDDKLRELGLKVLRFDNRQVLLETEAVVGVIYDVVAERLKN